jgi:Ca2+-binding RTX toxin-like protein
VLDTTFATDTITDFNPGADTIALDNTLFTALRSTGALDRAAFFEGPAAHDASDRLMYNSQTGDLLYDADGTGSGAAITVATLDPNLELANTNFVVI